MFDSFSPSEKKIIKTNLYSPVNKSATLAHQYVCGKVLTLVFDLALRLVFILSHTCISEQCNHIRVFSRGDRSVYIIIHLKTKFKVI